MKKNRIFRINFPDRKPLYIFTKDSWVGLVPLFSHTVEHGMITPISLWRFIKERMFK